MSASAKLAPVAEVSVEITCTQADRDFLAVQNAGLRTELLRLERLVQDMQTSVRLHAQARMDAGSRAREMERHCLAADEFRTKDYKDAERERVRLSCANADLTRALREASDVATVQRMMLRARYYGNFLVGALVGAFAMFVYTSVFA